MLRDDDPLRILMPWLDDEKEAAAVRGEARLAVEWEELVAALREVADAEGEDVTMQRFLKETGYKEYVIYKHFASWADLRVEVGLAARREADVIHSDEPLLEEAIRVIDECGGFPTIREFNERSQYPYHALYMRFGRRKEVIRRCEEFRASE